jgi:hypothetical protein
MQTERIEEIYNEIGTFSIELSPDPASLGPVYLQDLISRTRGYLNRVSQFIQTVHREKSGLETRLDAFEAAFQVSSDALLADDHRVTRLPNIDDRRAMINLLLREDRAAILTLKNQVKELGFVDKALRHRHKELENTMSAIRMQKSLIDSEISTGSFYGDESNTSRKSQWKTPAKTIPEDFGIDLDETELALLVESEPEALTISDQVMLLAAKQPDPLQQDPAESASSSVSEQPAVMKTQDVVVSLPKEPKSPASQELNDPVAVEKFLEGDDYSDLFDNIL